MRATSSPAKTVSRTGEALLVVHVIGSEGGSASTFAGFPVTKTYEQPEQAKTRPNTAARPSSQFISSSALPSLPQVNMGTMRTGRQEAVRVR